MPTEDKNLGQVLRQAIGETKMASLNAQAPNGQELSKGTAGETQSGGTPEYVSGIDISTLPEQERPVARRVLADKAKLLEDGYQKKFQEISQFKRQRDEILSLGISESEAARIIQDHVRSKTNAKDAKKEASRLIDQLKESAPDLETRKGLDNLEGIIKELTNIDEIKTKLGELENYVKYSRGREVQTREQSLNSELNSLADKYGPAIIDKYRDEVIKQGLTFTDANSRRLLNAIADPDELEQALLANSTKKQERKQEKINAISSPSSGMSAPSQDVDIRKTGMKSILSQVFVKK